MNLGHENRLPKMGHLGRPMTFSVIIPTFNRDDLLAQCLDCLIEGKQSGMSMDRNSSESKAIYEVIVTDDCNDKNVSSIFPLLNYRSGS